MFLKPQDANRGTNGLTRSSVHPNGVYAPIRTVIESLTFCGLESNLFLFGRGFPEWTLFSQVPGLDRGDAITGIDLRIMSDTLSRRTVIVRLLNREHLVEV